MVTLVANELHQQKPYKNMKKKFFVINDDQGIGAANWLFWESNFKMLGDKNQTPWGAALDGTGNMNERPLHGNL